MASFLLAVFFIGIILLLAVLFDFVCFFLVFFKDVEIQDGKKNAIPALNSPRPYDEYLNTQEWGLRSMQDDPESDSWGFLGRPERLRCLHEVARRRIGWDKVQRLAGVRSSGRLVTVYGNTPAKDSAMRLDTGSVRPARAKTSNS
jgi:hypothetical protein